MSRDLDLLTPKINGLRGFLVENFCVKFETQAITGESLPPRLAIVVGNYDACS